MGFFDIFSAKRIAKREAKLLNDKMYRTVGILLSFTPATQEEKDAESLPNYGHATFKFKRNGEWTELKVTLREPVDEMTIGDQWILKFDEDFTRIVTPQLKLSKDSVYRINED